MGKTLTEAAQAVLMNENANAATLKPGASGGEKIGPGAAAKIADAPVEVMGSGRQERWCRSTDQGRGQKDKQKASAKPGMPMQGITAAPETNLQEDEINEEEDVEISEELAEFIDQMVAEGASEDEIAQAIEENFELVEEKGRGRRQGR
jgi:hypothetical protein